MSWKFVQFWIILELVRGSAWKLTILTQIRYLPRFLPCFFAVFFSTPRKRTQKWRKSKFIFFPRKTIDESVLSHYYHIFSTTLWFSVIFDPEGSSFFWDTLYIMWCYIFHLELKTVFAMNSHTRAWKYHIYDFELIFHAKLCRKNTSFMMHLGFLAVFNVDLNLIFVMNSHIHPPTYNSDIILEWFLMKNSAWKTTLLLDFYQF